MKDVADQKERSVRKPPTTKARERQRQQCREWHRKKYASDPEWARKRNERVKEWTRRQKLLGLCVKCEKKATHSTLCEAHFFSGREDNWRKRRIPMTLPAFFGMFERQGRACRLCQRALSYAQTAVDHCHATGLVRGILCVSCNSALGKLGDTSASLQRVVAYLDGTLEDLPTPEVEEGRNL